MSLILLEPTDDLLAVIADRLAGEGADFSSNIVIFPEHRPGHYLRRHLARQVGQSLIPPQIFTLDDFVNQLYFELKGGRDHYLNDLDAVAWLFEIHQQAASPLGGSNFKTLDRFLPWGLKLLAELETLKKAAVPPEKIREFDQLIDLNLSLHSQEHFYSLSYIYEEFYKLLEARQASTLGRRFEEVKAGLPVEQLRKKRRIIVAGFFSLLELERQIIQQLLQLENCDLVLIKGKGLSELGEKLGFPREEVSTWEEVSPASTEIEFYLSPDTHGQIFALNRVLQEKFNREGEFRPSEKQVIVLPAVETLFPLYQFTLARWREKDFNISLGYPLSRTPLYSFFDKLFELIQNVDEADRFYIPDYLRFVLHPYIKNIFFPQTERTDLTRIMFHTLEEEFLQQKNRPFWRLEEIESDPEVRKRLLARFRDLTEVGEPLVCLEHLKQIHDQTIRTFLEIDSVGDFAQKIISLVEFIYQASTASQHLFFHRYAEAMVSRLEALAASQLAPLSFETRSGYFNLFRNLIAETRVPFPGTPLRGLQVLGFWETRCLRFEEVYFLDLNEDILPGTTKVNFLIPFHLRQQLNLPTYEDIEKRTEYYFRVLLNGARRACLFFVENSEKEKSRLVEKLIWERQEKEKIPEAASLLASVRYQVELKPREPRVIPKTEEVVAWLRQHHYSASSLDLYLKCPVRFYYAYVLNLQEKEEIAEAMERKEVGTLVHQILEDYFQPYLQQPLRREELLDFNRLEKVIDQVFKTTFGRSLSGSALLMYHQVSRHLKDFILHYQLPWLEKLPGQAAPVILSLEKTLEVRRAVNGHEFRLVARIDRLEKRGDNFYVLDYKSSANENYYRINFKKLSFSERSTWAETIGSLQLPLYVLLTAQLNRLPLERVDGRLLFLGKNRITPEIEYSTLAEEKEARLAQLELMGRIIDELLLEIINPAVPFAEEVELPVNSGTRREGPPPASLAGTAKSTNQSPSVSLPTSAAGLKTRRVRLAAKDACRFCPFTDLCGR